MDARKDVSSNKTHCDTVLLHFLNTMFYRMRVLFLRLNAPYDQLLKGLVHIFFTYVHLFFSAVLVCFCRLDVHCMHIVLPFGAIKHIYRHKCGKPVIKVWYLFQETT